MRRDRTGDPGLLYDMLAAARLVVTFVEGKTWNDYQASALLRSAVERQITIIGEAAWRVSAETKAAHPEIPWIKISPTRHKLVHELRSDRRCDRLVDRDQARSRPDTPSHVHRAQAA